MSVIGTLTSVFVVALAVALFGWLFPRKVRLLKKHGMKTTNQDRLELAKRGDQEAQQLARDSKVTLFVAAIGVIALVVLRAI